MVYITVGSAANPILEFLDEWSTENFEVSYTCNRKYADIVNFSSNILGAAMIH